MSEKKRFIAGAICPKCQTLDKLRFWQIGEICFRDCVACGYENELDALQDQLNHMTIPSVERIKP